MANPTKPRSRRAPQERSIETRARLLESANAALREVGYRGTTVQNVATRAGVSLGALQYHFPTKHDLMAAAIEHVFEERIDQLLGRMHELSGAELMAKGLELVFSGYREELFAPYLELVLAGRTDPELRPHVERIANRLADRAIAAFREVFGPTERSRPFEEVLPSLFFAVLEGLALGRIAGPGRTEYHGVLAALTSLAEEWLHPLDGTPKTPSQPS